MSFLEMRDMVNTVGTIRAQKVQIHLKALCVLKISEHQVRLLLHYSDIQGRITLVFCEVPFATLARARY
jgi:hypothetical protein